MALGVVTVRFPVENIAATLLHYDVIQVHRSATRGGVYTEITTTSSRVPLVAGKTLYEFDDPSGVDTSWYRERLFNRATGATSDFTAVHRADGEDAIFSGRGWARHPT